MPITLVEGEQRELDVQLSPVPVEPARLFGYITDAETGDPIASAVVRLFQSGIEIYYEATDINGYYDIAGITPGAYDGLIEAAGYIEQTF
jgi:protocatechuate 3,4-dioxygenase beta subunit